MIQWRLVEGVSSKCSLSVLLSTVETSRCSYYSMMVFILRSKRKIMRLLFERSDYLRVAYNTYSPSASPMIVIRKIHVCSYYSRVYFSRSSRLCGYNSRAATIRGWRLFKEIQNVCSYSHCHNWMTHLTWLCSVGFKLTSE